MIAHKHIGRIVLIAVAAAVLFCIAAMLLAPRLVEKYGTGVTMEYEQRIFDTSQPVSVNILMDETEWQSMLDTATQEVYHVCDVEINGTRFMDVGIRPKGNTSLSSIAMNPNTDRYSFKLEFDQFIDGQTAWGLDKLCLNNNYADATNMKEALIYDMFKYLGADASLYNTAVIYVNGEYWGVYLALEAVEDSFMLRNYGAARGELYKPDSMGMGGFDEEDRDFSFRDRDEASDEPQEEPEPTPVPTAEPDPMPPEGDISDAMRELIGEDDASGEASGSSEFPDFGGGGPFGGGGGQNLNYTDDELSSYSTIWRCEVTRTDEADHKRVVNALKHISQQEDLETYMDVDNLLRFMAVHNFSVNGDSLSGGMAHNYYLYENGKGQLNMIPWDYNLALGGMGMGGSDPNSVVNEPIDDSWQSTSFFDGLLENEEYLARYHEYYRQLVENYMLGDGLEEFYNRTRAQIDELVASDPNALYDYDEYDAAAETLYYLVKLRGESILGQLDGTIPSTSRGQREDSSTLIDASDIDLSVMGTMSMGGSFGGGGGFPGGFNPFRRRASSEPSGETQASGETDASGETSLSEGAASDEAVPTSAAPTSQETAVTGDAQEQPTSAEPAAGAASEETEGVDTEEESRSGRASGEGAFGSREMTAQDYSAQLWTLAACGAALIAGFVLAILWKRKQ